MSTHLLIAAMYLEVIPPARKLVLGAIADSADEHTLESAPGLPKLRAWSGLSKGPVMAHVAALEADRLIERVQAGRLGRRAVYRVFPDGVPAIPHPSEVAARYTDGPSEPVDNSQKEGTASRTLGSCLTPTRVLPAGPLHAYPSVSTRDAPNEPVETRPTPSTGFPGSRATIAASAHEANEAARRARGANNIPCHVHPDQDAPCRKCANIARKEAAADPTIPKRKAAEARALIHANRPTTEEKS